jgi:hypothetical protein
MAGTQLLQCQAIWNWRYFEAMVNVLNHMLSIVDNPACFISWWRLTAKPGDLLVANFLSTPFFLLTSVYNTRQFIMNPTALQWQHQYSLCQTVLHKCVTSNCSWTRELTKNLRSLNTAVIRNPSMPAVRTGVYPSLFWIEHTEIAACVPTHGVWRPSMAFNALKIKPCYILNPSLDLAGHCMSAMASEGLRRRAMGAEVPSNRNASERSYGSVWRQERRSGKKIKTARQRSGALSFKMRSLNGRGPRGQYNTVATVYARRQCPSKPVNSIIGGLRTPMKPVDARLLKVVDGPRRLQW